MTKRDLVKWLEKKQEEAVETAATARAKTINEAKEAEYKILGLDKFIDDISPLFNQILQKYNVFVHEVRDTDGVRISRYHWHYGYDNMLRDYGDRDTLRKEVAGLIDIDTAEYKEKVQTADDINRKVVHTYNVVIQTVKNLPTAKDGLEYLKKLGFDISEIQPAEHKKQLPATISVNVDTQYLLLHKKGDK